MADDGMPMREDLGNIPEQSQIIEKYFEGGYTNYEENQKHTHDDELVATEEGSLNPTFRDNFYTESSSLFPAFPQTRENHSFAQAKEAVKNNSALALANAPAMVMPHKERHVVGHEQLPRNCQICGKSLMDASRAMVYFPPSESASFHVALHVFCGKTASILPQIAQPNLEIMLKAGLKNKHGIGPDVNFALARTRSAVAQGGEAEKDPKRLDKEYYLVKEFEGHLGSIRSLHCKPPAQEYQMMAHSFASANATKFPSNKPQVHKAFTNSGMSMRPYTYTKEKNNLFDSVSSDVTQAPAGMRHGRVRCPCGGIYNPTKGTTSWKAHIKTKRHLLWKSRQSSSSIHVNNIACTDSMPSTSLTLQEFDQSHFSRPKNASNEYEENYSIAKSHSQSHNENNSILVAKSYDHGKYYNEANNEVSAMIAERDLLTRREDSRKTKPN